MVDRPIIFSGPMVRALLDGRKTQTRRLASSPLRRVLAGDRLWVREAWGCLFCTDDQKPRDIDPRLWSIRYFADDHIRPAACDGSLAKPEQIKRQRPSIHMPRWASRLTLVVQAARVEPLQSITDADAIAEGVVHGRLGWHVPGLDHPLKEFPILSRTTPREMYVALWDTLHGSGEWLGNPEVVALEFSVERENIDRLAA